MYMYNTCTCTCITRTCILKHFNITHNYGHVVVSISNYSILSEDIVVGVTSIFFRKTKQAMTLIFIVFIQCKPYIDVYSSKVWSI